MTYTFKLSRRLAISHVFCMLPLLALALACTSEALPTDASDPSLGDVVTEQPSYKIAGRPRGPKKPSSRTYALKVTPDADTIGPRTTLQFSVSLRASDGSAILDSIVWSATGGRVSEAGAFTADTVTGDFRVIARGVKTGVADTAAVSVVQGSDAPPPPPPPPPTLERVVLTPASVSLQTGATQQFAAAGIATDGSPSTVTIAWSATGGTVSSSGLYTAGTSGGSYRVIAKDQSTGKADTSAVTLTQPAPPPPSDAPPGAIALYPGDDLAAAVNARSAGTQFLLKAGVHRRQTIRPKDGMGFYGEPGAVLDGERVAPYAFETLNSAPRGVTIKGLIIQNYAPPAQQSAIQGDNGQAWTVEQTEVRYNGQYGVRIGPGGWIFRNNHVHHNSVIGVACWKCSGAILEGNDIHHNPPVALTEAAATSAAANVKLFKANPLTVRNNLVHDGLHKGIWLDTDNRNVIIEGNQVNNHGQGGIWYEANYNGIIRNNVIATCGTRGASWLDGAGIAVTNSPDVEIYGNTISGCANGITGMYVYATSGNYYSGDYGVKVLKNLYVHDNHISMATGQTGIGTYGTSSTAVWDSQNNRFERNSYRLSTTSPFRWRPNANLTEGQWKDSNMDVNGSFSR